ncbi:MAG: DsbA family protein [Robiginitomaculum sp.]|nr:DsbA family protein [Robiginitomaculum sp.]
MTMTNRFAMFAKTTMLASAAALVLSACSDKATSTSQNTDGKRTSYEVSTDHALGSVDAPITVVEYASVTCGACANWHTTVWPDFQTKYVDTGKVRFIYREFPTGNVSLANVGHLLANCAGPDKFFGMISVQMKRQNQILSAGRNVKAEYVALAKSAGMTEADFDACMSNQEQTERLQSVLDGGVNAGVNGTPTFFVNGKKEQIFTIEDFDKTFAPILGEPVPTDETSEKTEN